MSTVNLQMLPATNPQVSKLNTQPVTRVTVFMPCYNHVDHIADAIESVLRQKTDFGFKLIVQDDASTDGTAEIVADYASRYPDIIEPVLFKDNQFSQGHRIFALAWPRFDSEYVALLDGDDLWEDPQKLAVQVDFLDRNPDCSLCQTLTRYWDVPNDQELQIFPTKKKRMFFATLDDLADGNFIQTSAVMFRLSALPSLPSDFGTIPFGDYAIFALLARKGSIGLIPKVMALYRVHNASFWSSRNQEERTKKTNDVKRFIMRHIPKSQQLPWECALEGRPLPFFHKVRPRLRRAMYRLLARSP